MKIFVAIKGGVGSGNFGHAGRPGLVGGSGGGEGIPAASEDGSIVIDMKQPLTESERDVVVDYRMSHADAINETLYKGSMGGEIIREEIAVLDSVIAKGEFTEDGVVYRGVMFKKDKDVYAGMEGESVSSPAFMSTTTNPEVAAYHAVPGKWSNLNPEDVSSYVMRIQVPKGTNAVDLTTSGRNIAGALLGWEREALFGRNTRLHIESIVPGEGNIKIVNARIVQ